MKAIPDFTETEHWLLKTTLRERYGREINVELADAEIRLAPTDRSLTTCPIFYWQAEDGCNFVIFKTGADTYRCQFFYQPYKQMGTGVRQYTELAECAVALLQAQANFIVDQRNT
ncbi:hypothetical protein CKO12_05520 [Chromatium okenii]|uniref:hypothetical protein n=1 Tax=Chromatium okenii TaxID=61644 RepID=UPI0019046026|nr:hypothetical protein [Chromatium okenii]